MKNKMLELIKSSATNEDDFKSLVTIFNLHEQLQYATNIKQAAEDIHTWLNKEFKVDNLNFSLFDINKNYKEEILVKGEEFYLDDNLSHFFIINTHTSLNATVSFCATSKVHFKVIEAKYNTIEAAFLQISPIIQSCILKKNFIDEFDMVGRLNGDEFLVSILNNVNEHQAVQLAEKIISDFAEISILVNEETKQKLKKTICIGFEVYKIGSKSTITDSIKNADIALYEAKNKGRSQLFKFSELNDEDTIDLF